MPHLDLSKVQLSSDGHEGLSKERRALLTGYTSKWGEAHSRGLILL